MINNKYIKILKSISFIIGLIFLLTLTSYFFRPPNNIDWRKSKDLGLSAETDNSIDYLIVGDSLANRGVSPMDIWNKYGYAGYNCGVGAQRLESLYYMLKEILKNQSPKIIFIESNLFFRFTNLVPEINFALETELKEILPVFQHHSKWKDLLSTESSSTELTQLQFKGYAYLTKVNPYQKGVYVNKTNISRDIGPVQRYYFNLILDICKKYEIKLVLFSMPSPLSWNYEKHNATVSLANENGLELIDFNFLLDKINIDWAKDTYDKGDHMNFSGAQKISKYLADYMHEQNLLTDHRQDSRYSEWNKELELYLEKCK